jgi:phosphoglycolate phosphatase
VSSNAEPVVRRTLGEDLCGLISHFACSASMFGKARRFRAVIAATGHRRTDVIAVGDETRDVDAARTARIACASVNWGAASPEALDRAAPDWRLDTPSDLLALAPPPRA